CTICAAVHLPGGARCQSASGRPARSPSTRSGIAPNVAWSARMPKIVRMNLLRRYPIAFTLMALVIVSALAPLPPLVDAVTGAPPYDVDLVRPATYTLLAPLSDVLDALTFLSMGRAWWFLLVWVIGLAAWGVARSGSRRRRLLRASLGPLAVVALGVAAVLLPRPVVQLAPADSTLTVIDYHAH